MTKRPPGYREPTAEEMQCLPEGALTECIDGEWRTSNKIGQSVDVKSAKYFAIPTDKETVPYVHEVAADWHPTAAPIPGYVADTSAAPSLDPKAAFGIQKPQLHLVPPAANEEMAKALALGAEKYGTFNWRRNRVAMTTYLAAMKRHIDRIIDGEDIDPESDAHHLGHVMAGCAIVLDARRHGMLEDDRVLPKKGGGE